MTTPVTRADIEAGLRDLGLSAGDIVLVHSSLSSLGHVEGGARAVVEAFLAVLGPAGTLAVPTFGSFGAISDLVRDHVNAVASLHPMASVAAIGSRAEEICRDHWKAETAHGEGTPYMRMADLGGYVCLLGVDEDRNTTLHAVEELLRLPYLTTTDEVTFPTPEGEITRSWDFFPGPHRDFIGLDRLLRQRGILNLGRIGSAAVRLMRSREVIDCLLDVGREDPAFALCDNRNCSDCVQQRAALFQDRWAREDFTLVAAASLAGGDVPAILAACRSTGISAIELDSLGGCPVQTLPPTQVAAAVAELTAHGCRVVALRAGPADGDMAGLARTTEECGVRRLVVPLRPDVVGAALSAAGLDVSLSCYNTDIASETISRTMEELRAQRPDVGFTFSATGFARIEEKPFLTSYRNRLKRYTDQLDLEDCTSEGAAAPLGRGNAEIKELISILRCGGFGGLMVLGGGNAVVGDLGDAANRFAQLLETM